MSEIRFIREQGDLLDAAIARAPAPKPATPLTRIRSLIQPHKRIAAVVVALAVAGCAAVAATSLSGSTERLALGRVNCYYGTTMHGHVLGQHSDALTFDATLVGGETPESFCLQRFSSYSADELREFGLTPVHDPQLIACLKNATTIAVLIASGQADQCQHVGLTRLPKATNAAFASVHRLGNALRSLYLSRNCWSAPAFTKAVRLLMLRHGLGSWRIILPRPKPYVDGPPPGTGGDCAIFVSSGNPYLGNPYQALDGLSRTFTFVLGMSRSDEERWNQQLEKLTNETWARCYSPAAARTLVDRMFAGTGLTPRIAITAPINRGFHFALGPAGPESTGPGSKVFRAGQRAKERYFLSGCAIQPMLWIGTDDHFVDVWLTARHGRFIKFGTYPPPASYFRG
jgi:hypothetical protein